MTIKFQALTGPLRGFGVREALISIIVLISVTYAVVTAPRKGADLEHYQIVGRAWVAGTYQIGEGPAGEHPPFAIVLFSLLSKVNLDRLRILWVALNLSATFWILFLAINWLGNSWPLKARFYFCALFLSWAPFRVTLRNGQISLIIAALLMAAILAEQRKKEGLAGVLLGLSLCKYSLTFPFAFYYLWKKQWKVLAAATVIPTALTLIFAFRMHKTPWDISNEYARSIFRTQIAAQGPYMGSNDIKGLLLGLTGGNEAFSAFLVLALSIIALISMAILFTRTPQNKEMHASILALFALWSVYHRTYDSVLCVIPAAVFIDSIIKQRFARFSGCCLFALGLLALSIPGLLTVRLGLNEKQLSANILGFIGLHLERIIVFGVFWASLILLWKTVRSTAGPLSTTMEKAQSC